MILLRIAPNEYINSREINYIGDYEGQAIKKFVANMKKENKVYDTTGGKKIRTVIICKDNYMYLSNLTVETIRNRYESIYEQRKFKKNENKK